MSRRLTDPEHDPSPLQLPRRMGSPRAETKADAAYLSRPLEDRTDPSTCCWNKTDLTGVALDLRRGFTALVIPVSPASNKPSYRVLCFLPNQLINEFHQQSRSRVDQRFEWIDIPARDPSHPGVPDLVKPVYKIPVGGKDAELWITKDGLDVLMMYNTALVIQKSRVVTGTVRDLRGTPVMCHRLVPMRRSTIRQKAHPSMYHDVCAFRPTDEDRNPLRTLGDAQ